MLCENAAQSNDYFEFIGEYSGVLDYVKEEFNTECITVIDQRFAIAYVKKNGRTSIYGQNYPYNTLFRSDGHTDVRRCRSSASQKEYLGSLWKWCFSWNDRYRDRL